MSTSRKQAGYLWGEGNSEYANKDHYYRAMHETRISDEEYWAQSVFHGPSHARNLTNEIFQKRVRNGCKVYGNFDNIVVTDDETVRQAVKSEEAMNGVKSSNVASSTSAMNYSIVAPDRITAFYKSLEVVVPELNEDEIKILAYYLVKEGLDPVIEIFMDNPEIATLADAIREVWKLEDYKVSTLYTFVGTRYRTDSARWSVMSKFNDILKLNREIE